MSDHISPELRTKLRSYPNVTGIGYGFKTKNGVVNTEVKSIVIYVSRKVPIRGLSPSAIIPKTIDGIPTDVREIRIKVLAEDPNRYRPAPGGCSVGHYAITAGTLGAWVRYKDKVCILSNNHVLANSNAGSLGDRILQPGPYDGGQLPIAYLTEFKEIFLDGGNPTECDISQLLEFLMNLFGGLLGSKTRVKFIKLAEPNYVDAAVAESAEPIGDFVDAQILEIGNLNTNPQTPNLGDVVKKRGRTTRLTTGYISAIDVEVQVSGYGSGSATATFSDQVIVETPNNSEFSAGGDSGSLVVNNLNQPTGLLFAGGEDDNGRLITVINNIDRVVEAFPGLEFI